MAYLDDVVMHNSDEDDDKHLEIVRRNLREIIRAKLKCKPRKCQFFRKKISYLGYEISELGMGTDPAKVDKVLHWPFPLTGNDMLSFLGLCNYYRTLIQSFAQYADPLYKAAQS